MNTYIFLVRTISRIGGAELYLSSKIKFLEENGWHCHVFFHEESNDVLIPDLKKYIPNYNFDLRIPIANVSHKSRNTTINNIKNVSHLSKDDKIIIESFTLRVATWGEYIAKEFNAKHFIYYIDEHISPQTVQMDDFIHFKISQKLFYCIKDEVLMRYVPDEEKRKELTLPAVGCSSNNVLDIETNLGQDISEHDLNIFSIGRMEKPYFNHMVNIVCDFANEYANNKFNFIVIGDTTNKDSKTLIFNKIKNVKNLNLTHLGYVWPIPRSLMQKASVIIASAGAVLTGYLENIPTIAIDCDDFEAIGIFGYNTINTLFRTQEDSQSKISDYLRWILIDRKTFQLNLRKPRQSDYSKHIDIINATNTYKYYRILESKRMIKYHNLRRLIHKVTKYTLPKKITAKIRTIRYK